MDIEKLEKLHELKEKGILSPEEFEITKQQILYEVENNRVESVIANSNSYNCNHKSLWAYFLESITVKYACFNGRASRREFFGYILSKLLIGLFIGTIMAMIAVSYGHNDTTLVGLSYILFVVSLFFLLPDLGVLIRRFHDAGFSGICVIPTAFFSFMAVADGVRIYYGGTEASEVWLPLAFLATICNLPIVLMKSEPKENRYGPVPDGVLV